MKKEVLREIMQTAWQLVKDSAITLADALKQAWKWSNLRKALKAGNALIHFRKADGTDRLAIATLVDTDKHTKGSGRKSSTKVQVYWDVEIGAFRSFTRANLIEWAS